jgi:hypothetical protein
MNETRVPQPFDPRTERLDPRRGQPPSSGPKQSGVIDRPSSPASGPYEDILFHGLDAEQFKSRWHEIQAGFVDAPEQSVKQADELVKGVIHKLESEFGSARADLERCWAKDAQPSTEDLRKALQRYRAFFDRLLAV